MISAREAAYRSLVKMKTKSAYSNLEVDSAIKKYSLEGAERSLFSALVYGVTERLITLDYYISAFSTKAVDKLDFEVLTVLRLSAYQIFFLDRVPDHAAVNEGVELAKRRCKRGSEGFVNAVLRKLIQNKNNIKMPTQKRELLSVKYSVPEWIIELWLNGYGEEKCLEILEGINKTPRMTLRVNTLVNTRVSLSQKLEEAGIATEPTDTLSGLRLLTNASYDMLKNAADNGFYIQDEASQKAVAMLAPKAGDFIIDTCACPGGKSFGAAITMENEGRLLSIDLHESKLSLIEKGACNLGIEIIETRAHNSRECISEFIGKADRVICDVPCSGLGVIAKKPETRYKDKNDVQRLPQIQYEILNASANYLKEGGTLLYSTCTLNPAENEDIVNAFLSNKSEFSLKEMRTFFPVAGESDGFFVAVLQK